MNAIGAHSGRSEIRGRLWALAFLFVVLFSISALNGNDNKAFVSSELRFTDPSASGLSIVPASCPSDPHYAGECGGGEGCTALFYCVADDLYYRNGSCVSNFIQSCAYGCASGACQGAPTPEGNLQASPRLVQQGEATQISWSASGVTSCSVVGSNGDSWSGTSGTATTTPITQQTVYTLSCGGANGSLTETDIVNVLPVFEEI